MIIVIIIFLILSFYGSHDNNNNIKYFLVNEYIRKLIYGKISVTALQVKKKHSLIVWYIY